MFIYKHLTANSVQLMDFPFRRELSMEAYLIENQAVLALDSKYFKDVNILESEITLQFGGKKGNTDGRIDILADYGNEYLAVIELKSGELYQSHVEQIRAYLQKKEQIIKMFPNAWDFNINPDPKWIGVLVGTTIDPILAANIRNGLTILGDIPIAALTLRRYRGEDGQIYVVTDTYLGKSVSGKDYTKYLFNKTVYSKNRLVLSVVNSYVEEHPNVSFAELKKVFPDDLQGHSYGVFTSLEDAEKVSTDSGYKRHFIEPDEIIQLSDEKIAVCNQWGKGNIKKFLEKAKQLKFEITKSE